MGQPQVRHNLAVTVVNPNQTLVVSVHEQCIYAVDQGQLQILEGKKTTVYAAGFWVSFTAEPMGMLS